MRIRWLTIFLDLPAAAYDDDARFWARVTASTVSARRGAEGEFATLVPASGDAHLRLQRVAGNPGCHLDLHLDPRDQPLEDVLARAGALGARVVHRSAEHVVLASPGGFAFCLVRWEGEVTPSAPVELDGGGAARLDQLCLDIPPERFEAEQSFWAELTGWPVRHLSESEFTRLLTPADLPVKLLLQRRDKAEPDEPVTAHPDLATADADRLAEVHARAGARVQARFPGWIALTDPAGLAYCLTRRPPSR